MKVIEPFGRNGAALAALGDMVLGFFGVDPFAANNVGVKLGESTFNPFLFDQGNTISALFLDIEVMLCPMPR